jgi:cytolysin-activating lysine-acyltransferase
MRNELPAAYLSWACLSPESEVRYLVNPHSLTREDKRSGKHLWLLNWTAPFGGTDISKWVVRDCLFHSSVGHMLRVKPGNHEQARVVSARGAQVSDDEYAKEISRMYQSFEQALAQRQNGSQQ